MLSGTFKPGTRVYTTPSGAVCEVQELLGDGAQGEVYRAKLGDEEVALKWYFPYAATPEQRSALEALVNKGSPSERFLWPKQLVEAQGTPGFGYIMNLRDARFHSMVDLMKNKVQPSFRALARAGLGLAQGYRSLHAKGWCYRDINFGNVFFDPQTGDVQICDNDNVVPDGTAKGGVSGTPKFRAPEVVRGENLPSTQTDLYSLAVLLFYMFMINHPLEGKREAAIHSFDGAAELELFGRNPIFIFDPNDGSNSPDPRYHDNANVYWRLYPRFLRDLFTETFTIGLSQPNKRVRESQWQEAMIRLQDVIVRCRNPQCGVENFYDSDASQGNSGRMCWHCNQPIPTPLRLRFGPDNDVVISRDMKLHPHHTGVGRNLDCSKVTAELNRHPSEPGVWGIRNLSDDKWVATMPDGSIQEVEPGRSVRVARGVRIHFGGSEATIVQ